MTLPSIAVINFSQQLDEQEVQEAIRAVNRQVLEDFLPIWGSGRVCKLHGPVFAIADIDTLASDPVFADSVIYVVDVALLPVPWASMRSTPEICPSVSSLFSIRPVGRPRFRTKFWS